jgi:hypothetical protein
MELGRRLRSLGGIESSTEWRSRRSLDVALTAANDWKLGDLIPIWPGGVRS